MNNWQRGLVSKQLKGNHPESSTLDNEPYSRCLNCGTCYKGNYCPNCGQPKKTSRLTLSSVFGQMISLLTNVERGVIHTCIDLCYRPGYMMRDYIKGHRVEYTKPIQLIFVLGTVSFLLHLLLFQSLGFDLGVMDEAAIEDDKTKEILGLVYKVCNWVASNQAIFYVLIVSLMVLPNKLCFNWTKFGRYMNIAEHFSVMVYVGCQLLMVEILSMPIYKIFLGRESEGVGAVLPLLILVWDFHQLMHIKVLRSLRLTVTSSILAFILFVTLVLLAVIVFYYLYLK